MGYASHVSEIIRKSSCAAALINGLIVVKELGDDGRALVTLGERGKHSLESSTKIMMRIQEGLSRMGYPVVGGLSRDGFPTLGVGKRQMSQVLPQRCLQYDYQDSLTADQWEERYRNEEVSFNHLPPQVQKIIKDRADDAAIDRYENNLRNAEDYMREPC